MKIVNLPTKLRQRKFLRYSVSFAFLAVLALTMRNSISAQNGGSVLFYKDVGVVQCEGSNASICPYGSDVAKDISDNMILCRESNVRVGDHKGGSKYCELMTGDSEVKFDEDIDEFVCAKSMTGNFSCAESELFEWYGDLKRADGSEIEVRRDLPEEIEKLLEEIPLTNMELLNRASEEAEHDVNENPALLGLDANVEEAFDSLDLKCYRDDYTGRKELEVRFDRSDYPDREAYNAVTRPLLGCYELLSEEECGATAEVTALAGACSFFPQPEINCAEYNDVTECHCSQDIQIVHTWDNDWFDDYVHCTGSDNSGDAYLIGSESYYEATGEAPPSDPEEDPVVAAPLDQGILKCVDEKLILPVVPDFGANVDTYTPERYKQKSFDFRKAIEYGLIIARSDLGNETVRFCNDPGTTLVRDMGGTQKCYRLDYAGLMRPCQLSVHGVGNEVVMYGLRPSITSGPPTPYLPPASSPSSTGHIPLVHLTGTTTNLVTYTDHAAVAAGVVSPASFTAKDVMASRGGNIGCSQFYELNITPVAGGGTTMSIDIVDPDGYENCMKCIYRGTTFRQDFIHEDLLAYDSSGSPIAVSNDPAVRSASGVYPGASITPNLEPFAIAAQGKLYTELGCIDARNAAGFTNTVLRMAIGLMGILVIFRIIQGALTLRAGDPESVEEGRDVIVSALIALLIVIFSVALVNFMGINILGIKGFNPFG